MTKKRSNLRMRKKLSFGKNSGEVSDNLNAQSFHELLTKDIVVPDYQRGYVWTPDDIDSFIEDLINRALPYYGIIVLYHQESKGGRAQKVEIVDGQQRLITLAYVLDKFDKVEFRDSESQVEWRKVKEAREGQSPDPLDFKIFGSLIEYESQDQARSKIQKLRKILSQKKVIVVKCKDESEAQMVFVQLNTKGVPLTALDLMISKATSRSDKQELKRLVAGIQGKGTFAEREARYLQLLQQLYVLPSTQKMSKKSYRNDGKGSLKRSLVEHRKFAETIVKRPKYLDVLQWYLDSPWIGKRNDVPESVCQAKDLPYHRALAPIFYAIERKFITLGNKQCDEYIEDITSISVAFFALYRFCEKDTKSIETVIPEFLKKCDKIKAIDQYIEEYRRFCLGELGGDKLKNRRKFFKGIEQNGNLGKKQQKVLLAAALRVNGTYKYDIDHLYDIDSNGVQNWTNHIGNLALWPKEFNRTFKGDRKTHKIDAYLKCADPSPKVRDQFMKTARIREGRAKKLLSEELKYSADSKAEILLAGPAKNGLRQALPMNQRKMAVEKRGNQVLGAAFDAFWSVLSSQSKNNKRRSSKKK